MKPYIAIACAMMFATAAPAAAQDDAQRATARSYLQGVLPGLRYLSNGYSHNNVPDDYSYENADGFHVSTLVSYIETNDPCWLQFNRHFAGFATEEVEYKPEDAIQNLDFRNVDYVLTDGLRVFIKNAHWGPYPSIIYATDPAMAQRLEVSVRAMSAACKGRPE